MNSFFKTLIKPDWDSSPKRSDILHAANLLQVGEFQLIQLAYKVWYGEELPEEKINKIFSEYMVSGIIPMWVTQYAKDIIKLDNVNLLDINNKKYHIYDNEFGDLIINQQQRKMRGIFYSIIIGLVFFASHYLAATSVDEAAGFFPPYIEKKIVYPELYDKNKN